MNDSTRQCGLKSKVGSGFTQLMQPLEHDAACLKCDRIRVATGQAARNVVGVHKSLHTQRGQDGIGMR